mgnify:CR=1 FL=1
MTRIDAAFKRLQARGEKALIPFITAGDPALDQTVPLLHALVEAGADVLVAGTATFTGGPGQYAANIQKLRGGA